MGNAHICGQGVVVDNNEALQHYKLTAIGGHERARYNLGIIEMSNGNIYLSMRHYVIAARCGDDLSLEEVGKKLGM